MRAAVRAFADRGGPVYAECGGLMYLTQAIVDVAGARHPMAGVLPAEARMHDKLRALGYVEVETQSETLLGGAGTRFRGHQFRYSELSPEPDTSSVARAYSVRKRRGGEVVREGYRMKNVLASYVHAHWASNPNVAAELVRACARARAGR
jgi:cobyrinic acid a,c-diamide synthase